MRCLPALFSLLAANLVCPDFVRSSAAQTAPAGSTGDAAPSAAVQLEEITVDGNRARGVTQPLGARPAQPENLPVQVQQAVTVIDRAEIERTNAAGTLDLLHDVPSLSINRAGGINGTVFLRGLNTNDFRVPMFIDGDRFRGRNTLQLMLVSPFEIERIEVVRGGAAYMYGSDVLGGAINIVTRRPHGNPNGPWRITGGDTFLMYNTNGNGLQAGGSVTAMGDGFDLTLSANGRLSDDYHSGDGVIGNSDYRTGGGGIVLGYAPSDNQRVEAAFRMASVTDGRANAQPAYPLLTNRDATIQVYTGRVSYTGDFTEGPFSRVEASLYRNEFFTKITNDNRVNPLQETNARSYVLGPAVWGGRVAGTIPWQDTSTTIGLDFIRESRPGSEASSTVTRRNAAGNVTSVTENSRKPTGPDATQLNIGAFANSSWNPIPQWTLTGAGRFDWVLSDVDTSPLASPNLRPAFEAAQNTTATATTGNIGLAYRPIDMLELTGSIGTSFRYPVTMEMFAQGLTGTTYTIPNPDLKPEYGINYEAGARLNLRDATIRMTAFYSSYRDLILSVPTTYMGYNATQRQNVGEAEIAGIEMDWRWQFTPSWNLFGSASALRATNTTTDKPLPYIAPFSGRIGLQYALPERGMAFTGTVDWGVAKTRIDTAQEFETGGYAILNLGAEFQLNQMISPRLGNTTLVMNLNNLLNTSYRTAAAAANTRYPEGPTNPLLEPGRSFTVSLHTRF